MTSFSICDKAPPERLFTAVLSGQKASEAPTTIRGKIVPGCLDPHRVLRSANRSLLHRTGLYQDGIERTLSVDTRGIGEQGRSA